MQRDPDIGRAPLDHDRSRRALDLPSLCMAECSVMQSVEILAELDARRSRARARASAGWLPLLLTGVAMLGSFPAYAGWLDGPGSACGCWSTLSDMSWTERLTTRFGQLAGGSRPLALYWLAVVPVVYALSVAWFALSGRRTGLRQRWGLHVLVGVGSLLGLLLSLLPPLDNLVSHSARPLLTPLLALALGLVALGWVERDLALCWAGAAVGATAVAVAALSHYVSGLPDSFVGNVGQSLLAPSVEVAGVGLLLIVTSLLLRRTRRRGAAVTVSFIPEVP
jgi:hypothetical protein